MVRVVLVLASVLLIVGGFLLQRAAHHETASVPMAPPTAMAEPMVTLSRPPSVVGVPLNLAIEAPSIDDGDNARAVMRWWQDQALCGDLVDSFKQLAADAQQPTVYHGAADRLVVRFPAHGRDAGGWAEFSTIGDLLACQLGDAMPAPAAMAIEVTVAEQQLVAIRSRRLAAVDTGLLTMMLLQWNTDLPADGWRRVCGNWTLDARVTDFMSCSSDGSFRTGGRRIAISLGEDGVLRDYSVLGWRAGLGRRICCYRTRCGVAAAAEDMEPALPVANN